MKRVVLSAFLALGLCVSASAQNSVVDIIVNSPVHDSLEKAVIAADLAGVLSGPGPFTVFAPTNTAFDDLQAGIVTQLQFDTAVLQNILTYHVVGDSLTGMTLPMGQSFPSSLRPAVRGGFSLQVNNGTSVAVNGTAMVTQTIVADNGVVHIVDEVLFPLTLGEVVVNSPVHETLEVAVDSSGFLPFISDFRSPAFTLFAPTDAAFADLPTGAVADLIDPANRTALQNVILYHLNGRYLDTAQIAFSTPIILNQADDGSGRFGIYSDISVNDDGNFTINGNQFIIQDILTLNGVVHVIDEVLTVPTIADFVGFSSLHNTLETAVGIAGLGGALGDNSTQLTLFAPTDAAFETVDPMALSDLIADSAALAGVLLYHALGDSISFERVGGGLGFTNSLAGFTLQTIKDANEDSLTVDNITVDVANIKTTNGTIHVLQDGVLLPQNVVGIAQRSPVHGTLVTQVINADLVGTLADADATYTVFAPTDAAFAGVDPDALASITDDPDGRLVTTLTYHVLPNAVSSTDIIDNSITTATTVQGEEVTIDASTGSVVLNGNTTVVIADIVGTNGIVHVVNNVLLPDALVSTQSVLASNAGIAVGPVPADDFTQVTMPEGLREGVQFSILDVNGRVLRTQVINGTSHRVDLSGFAAGTYFLSFESDNARFHQPLVVR